MQVDVIFLSCGKTHFAVIDSSHLLYTAGEGSNGCLGFGDCKDRKTLSLVKTVAKLNVFFF